MPFEDTNADVFLAENSFTTWHEALDRYRPSPKDPGGIDESIDLYRNR